MQKHLMLLFLSDAKINRDTGALKPAGYKGVDSNCYTTNESSVKILVTGYKDTFAPHTFDRIFVFTSDKVRKPICQVSHNDKVTETRNVVELFKDDLREVIPNIDDILVQQEYHEDSRSSLEMQQTIVDMAKQIQDYVAQYPDDDFVLHADCTGGFRHAIMMTLDVVRLMQYNRVQTGEMIYSEYNPNGDGWVQSINDVYDLFDLTAGAEEFVRFGSVDAINTYFAGKEISPELQNLLNSMKTFSDAIKICHAGSFAKAIKSLHTALAAFANKQDAPSEDKKVRFYDDLMHRMEGRIIKDYQALWDADDLQLVSWCLEHDYLQQALTLYTERVPELLTDNEKGIFHLTAAGGKSVKKKKKKSDKRSKGYYTFCVYDEEKRQAEQKVNQKALAKLTRDFRRSLMLFCGKKATLEEFKETLKQTVNEIFTESGLNFKHIKDVFAIFEKLYFLQDNPQVLKGNVFENIKDNEVQHILQVYQNNISEAERNKFHTCPYGGQRLKMIEKFLGSKVTENVINALFSSLVNEVTELTEPRQIWLCKYGYAESDLPLAQLESLVNEYNAIRDERNHSNHARTDSDTTLKEISNKISASLGHIRSLTK